jgi:Na+-driven multidrug efflux pump
MKLMFLTYAALAWMEVGSGVLRGLGRSLTSTIITMIGACFFRIVWILTAFRAMPTLEIIYISYPISWLLTTAAFLPCALVIIKKKKERLKQ